MFPCLKRSSPPAYYGFIDSLNEELYVVTVNAKTKKIESFFVVNEEYPSIKKFIEDIPTIFGKGFKTVLLNVFYFKAPEFLNNYKFCEAIKAKLDLTEIPYHFVWQLDIRLTSMLATTNTAVKTNDTVIIVFTENDKYLIGEYQFTTKGYKCIRSLYINAKQENEIIRKEILGSSKPAKTVATTFIHDEKNRTLLMNLNNIMQKSDGLVICDCKSYSVWIQGVVKISKWILDSSYVKYHWIPRCRRDFMIIGKVGNVTLPCQSFEGGNCLIPFVGDERMKRGHAEYALAYTDISFPEPQYLEPIPYYNKCHRSKITFKVDVNSFYFCQIEPIVVYDEIQNLPDILNNIQKLEIPVITFIDNLSIICLHKNGEYKFADGWNGVYGEELLISFADKKPKFCKEARSDWKRKSTSVVFDLIQIMSLPADKIETEPLWNFTITKDDENPVLIELDNFDGKKKAASPASLMAMLLKEHLKVIKNEMGGEKPKEIAFWSLDIFDAAGKTRVKEGLKEACKLLKIECRFLKKASTSDGSKSF